MRKFKVVYQSMSAFYELGEYIAEDESDAKQQAWSRSGSAFSRDEFFSCLVRAFPVPR